MKFIKTASGKKQIKMSRKEWQAIGKKAGWTKEAQIYYDEQDTEDTGWIASQLQSFLVDPIKFWENMTFAMGKAFRKPSAREQLLKDMLNKLRRESPKLEMLTKDEQKGLAKRIIGLKGEIEKEKEENAMIERLKEDEAPEEIQQEKEVALEPNPQEVEPEINTDVPTLDDAMFATPKQVEEIKNNLLDRYMAKEITEDQLKNMMSEFAKKYNQKIVLSFTDRNGKKKTIKG